MEDPSAFGSSSLSQTWVILTAEEETDVENMNPEHSYTPGVTPNSEISVQTNAIEKSELTVEETDHEMETSVLRSRTKIERKNPA